MWARPSLIPAQLPVGAGAPAGLGGAPGGAGVTTGVGVGVGGEGRTTRYTRARRIATAQTPISITIQADIAARGGGTPSRILKSTRVAPIVFAFAGSPTPFLFPGSISAY